MKVALTGASGFIGRHVAAELLRRGLEPVALRRAGSVLPPALAGLRTVAVDFDVPAVAAFEAAGRPEVLVHLAWGGLPNYRSRHHFEREAPQQYRWLAGLVEAGLGRLVVTGTCFEYGFQSGALAESLPAQPANPYAFAKHLLHRQLEFLRAERPFELTWARLFYLHGEGQAAGSLWPLLKAAVARGDARFPMSGGEQLRDYLPVTDAARHLADLAAAPRGQGTVNVCSGRPVSVRSLVEGWIAAEGWPIEPEYGRYPYPDHEPMAFWGDDARLRRCLAASRPGGIPATDNPPFNDKVVDHE